MNKDYVVYSLQLAHELTNKGFEIKATGINFNNPKLKVFYFENTVELQKAIKEFNTQPK